MRLFFYIALILTLSSCGALKDAQEPVLTVDSDSDGVIDLIDSEPNQILDSDGDGVPDFKDNCPYAFGLAENMGCPAIEMAQTVSIELPNQFIHSLDEIKNKDLREFLIQSGKSAQDVNMDILNYKIKKGELSEKEYTKYKAQIESGKFPSTSAESSWIPNLENMDIVDKTSNDTTSSRGTIAYSVPSEMVVGKQYSIKVRITKQKGDKANQILVIGDREIPISDISLDSKITIENIRVERTMIAQLLSEDGSFKITTMNTENQIIEDEGYTEWSWVIVPLKKGTNYLKMIIKINIVSNGASFQKDIIVFDKNIKVKANVTLGVESWISKYWQWIMTTIIIPLVIFFYKKRQSKKTQNVA